jgi:hypothetical protein
MPDCHPELDTLMDRLDMVQHTLATLKFLVTLFALYHLMLHKFLFIAKTLALRISVFLGITLEAVGLRKLVSSSEKFISKSRQTG